MGIAERRVVRVVRAAATGGGGAPPREWRGGDAVRRARALPAYAAYVSGVAGDGAADDGSAALLAAACAGDCALVEALVAEGFFIDARGGPRGETALAVAAAHGHAEVVELLFEAGADLGALDAHGCTPAEAAREHGHGAVAALIDEYGGGGVTATG